MRLLVLLIIFVSTPVYAGYNLHVTRKVHWANDVGPKISFKEWKEHVSADRDILRDQNNSEFDFVVTLPNETFPVWYNTRTNEIYTKNPSKNAIRKLIEIAEKLKAKVQGDEGEFY